MTVTQISSRPLYLAELVFGSSYFISSFLIFRVKTSLQEEITMCVIFQTDFLSLKAPSDKNVTFSTQTGRQLNIQLVIHFGHQTDVVLFCSKDSSSHEEPACHVLSCIIITFSSQSNKYIIIYNKYKNLLTAKKQNFFSESF